MTSQLPGGPFFWAARRRGGFLGDGEAGAAGRLGGNVQCPHADTVGTGSRPQPWPASPHSLHSDRTAPSCARAQTLDCRGALLTKSPFPFIHGSSGRAGKNASNAHAGPWPCWRCVLLSFALLGQMRTRSAPARSFGF